MSKNNKKQHRTDGVFNSNNETYAVPQCDTLLVEKTSH